MQCCSPREDKKVPALRTKSKAMWRLSSSETLLLLRELERINTLGSDQILDQPEKPAAATGKHNGKDGNTR